MKNEKNNAVIAGEICTEPTEYDCNGENFYSFNLSVKRKSGTADILPVNISKILLNNIKAGDKVCLEGQIRTYNRIIDGKSKLIIVFFAQEVLPYTQDGNEVNLHGYICKPPQFRITPLNREICDVLVAVNRERNYSDYIPCIVWGRTARLVGELNTGAEVCLVGRLQSREYDKKTEKGVETRVAYEVSVSRISDPNKQGKGSDD